MRVLLAFALLNIDCTDSWTAATLRTPELFTLETPSLVLRASFKPFAVERKRLTYVSSAEADASFPNLRLPPDECMHSIQDTLGSERLLAVFLEHLHSIYDSANLI